MTSSLHDPSGMDLRVYRWYMPADAHRIDRMMQINLIEDSSTQYFIKKIQNDLFLAISKNKFFRYEEIVANNDVFVYEIHFVLFVYVNNVVFRRLYQFVATFIQHNFYYDFKHCLSRSNYEWVSFIVYRMIESFPNTNI